MNYFDIGQKEFRMNNFEDEISEIEKNRLKIMKKLDIDENQYEELFNQVHEELCKQLQQALFETMDKIHELYENNIK
jgi:hypothetical protein